MPSLVSSQTVTTFWVTCEDCGRWVNAQYAAGKSLGDGEFYRELRARFEFELVEEMYSREEAVRLAAVHDARWHPEAPCRLCGHSGHLPHTCLTATRASGAVCGCV